MNTFRSAISRTSNVSYMDVASYQQNLNKEEPIDYKPYLRKVSKYDIDRGAVDFTKLRREKEKDRADNVKIKLQEINILQDDQKKLEAKQKEEKIKEL